MGVGAAAIFPATLAIITNVFTDSRERAKAIGIWSAVSGIGVAAGPIAGGWLLEHFWWGSIFYVNIPVVVVAIVAAIVFVPESKDRTPRASTGSAWRCRSRRSAALVFTIIEAPEYGWLSRVHARPGSPSPLGLIGAFVVWELRVEHPLLPVRIFENLRFSAASVSVTSAFFALFGFVFLITQYFQLIRGYTPLQAGVRTLPVAFSIAARLGAVTAAWSHRIGTKLVVAGGLASMALGFLWVSTASAATPYLEIVGQMILLGAGLGATTAPATESIMGSLVTSTRPASAPRSTTPPASSAAPSASPSSVRCSPRSTSPSSPTAPCSTRLPDRRPIADRGLRRRGRRGRRRNSAPRAGAYLSEVSNAFLVRARRVLPRRRRRRRRRLAVRSSLPPRPPRRGDRQRGDRHRGRGGRRAVNAQLGRHNPVHESAETGRGHSREDDQGECSVDRPDGGTALSQVRARRRNPRTRSTSRRLRVARWRS